MFDPKQDEAARLGYETMASGRAPSDGYLDDAKRAAAEQEAAMLDSAQAKAIHGRCMGYYLHELDVQSDNREQMALDE